MVKVCYYMPFSKIFNGFGGAERRIPYIFSKTASKNISITLVVLTGKHLPDIKKELEKYTNDEIKVIYVKNIWGAFYRLFRNSYDIYIYNDAVIKSWPAIIVGVLKRKKRILTMPTYPRTKFIFNSKLEKILVNLDMKFANIIDTLYPSSKTILEEKTHAKIYVTPCTLTNFNEFCKDVKKEKLILFSGRLIAPKGPQLFIDAIAEIQNNIRDKGYKCLLCGEGPLKASLANQIEIKECNDIIKILGYCNMEEVTPYAKIFCSLQEKDNYPSQSLLEAITAGCYCIATNCGDTKKIVKKSFGVLVEDSKESVAQALKKAILMNDSCFQAIERAGKLFSEENFDIDKAVRYYENLFLNKN